MLLMDATLQVQAKIDNVSEWCRINGINRRTFYRHRARIQAEGEWRPRSTRPKTSPQATPEPVVAEILRLRTELTPDNGADPIGDALTVLAAEQDWAARGWRVPARATINRILARAGLLESNPKKRPKSSYRSFTYARPRDCYQIDATEITLATGDKAVVFDVLDDCTRMLVACTAAPAETTTAAITAITTATTTHGAPGIVLCDNGAAFTARHRFPNAGPSKFARTLTAWGTRLIHSSPYHPQTCGKVERHHRTLKRWLATQPTPPGTLTELQTQLDTYRVHYNTRRHSSLDRHTPEQTWTASTTPGGTGLGGPGNLPTQTDATIHHLTVNQQGLINLGHATRIRIGRDRAGQAITIVRDHNRATAYTSDGNPIGHIHINHTKNYQGPLTPAA